MTMRRRSFYLEIEAADGLVAGARIKAIAQAGNRRHQQAADFGAVALKHADTFMTLRQNQHKFVWVRSQKVRK